MLPENRIPTHPGEILLEGLKANGHQPGGICPACARTTSAHK